MWVSDENRSRVEMPLTRLDLRNGRILCRRTRTQKDASLVLPFGAVPTHNAESGPVINITCHREISSRKTNVCYTSNPTNQLHFNYIITTSKLQCMSLQCV
jgi:hypothetical protein